MRKFNLLALSIIGFIFIGVMNVNAKEAFGEEFKKISTDGTITFKTVKPEDCEHAQFMLSALLDGKLSNDYYVYAGCYFDSEKSTMDKIEVGVQSNDGNFYESHLLTPTFIEPDEKSTTEVQNIVKKLKHLTMEEMGDARNGYVLSDLYLINYLNTNKKYSFSEPGAATSAFNFTKDIIKLTNGSNITYKVIIGAGEDFSTGLFQMAIGQVTVLYNGYAYTSLNTGITELNILYVDPNATDFAKAAQDRINDYLGYDAATVVLKDTLSSLDYQACDYSTYDFINKICIDYLDKNYNSEGLFDPDKLVDNNYYEVTINGNTHRFVLYKGTAEELTYPSYLGSDVESKIEITSTSSSIPLDTALDINGVIDDSIKESLGTDKYTAFDIKLYSGFKKENITTLENGKFLVSIPVPEYLEGKQIVVYYITSTGDKENHEVTVKDKIATFETNHFSTYIMTEKLVDKIDEEENPKTLDKVIIYSVIGGCSILGIVGTLIYLKKKKK